MRRLHLILFSALVVSLTACSNGSSVTNADSVKPSAAAAAPAPAPAVEPKPEPKVEPKTLVPAGTKFRVALLDSVSSDKSRAGDQFLATLAEPIVVDGKTVLVKGTRVRGRVMDAKESGRVKGRASIELTLTEVMREKGSIVIDTKPYSAIAEATKKRDAAIIGGGAGLGAAIGAIAGGGKGAAIGAAVGGGAGTGTVLATKGKEIHYPPETRLQFTLAKSIEI